MQFIETRGNDGQRKAHVNFSDAILNPSASFGGLYVPESLPDMGIDFLADYINSDYKTLAFDLLKKFEIDIEDDLLWEALNQYDTFDDAHNPVPVESIEEDCFVAELYHGPTRAFKDMALQPFGVILSTLAKQRGEEYLIMAATSGDTGPATLETFKNRPNIRVACLYPDGGTSDVQRLQMVTEDADNLKVMGIHGNFDDAQRALKSLLGSETFKADLKAKGIKLSAANSVNFGRIIFQIIYHFYSYLELVKQDKIVLGEKVYLIVPSGNFGNALGAYYAKKAGLPIEKILIASNTNNILTDLINTGEYDIRDRELMLTNSPAMDILKSSNVERVLFDKFGSDRTREMMMDLEEDGIYRLNSQELAALREDFDAIYSNDLEGRNYMSDYAKKGYIMDPHTATCIKAYRELRIQKYPAILCSTAEWTKFSMSVAEALELNVDNDLDALEQISERTGLKIPEMIHALFTKPVVHDTVVDQEKIREEMLAFL